MRSSFSKASEKSDECFQSVHYLLASVWGVWKDPVSEELHCDQTVLLPEAVQFLKIEVL